MGSATTSTGSSALSPRKRRTRAVNSATSASSKALPSDSMGTLCRTLPNASTGAAPMRREGLSARRRAGKRASISALRWRRVS